MEMINGVRRTFQDLTVSQRSVMGAALVVVLLAGAAFARWVSSPTYTVLYSNIDQTQLSQVIDELESSGIPYQLEGGGSRVLVPRSSVYQVRADLAAAGVQGSVVPEGYELLDRQGLSVSDFRQRVDYQRALEGELARTLTAMQSIRSSTVHLVIPEEALFAENQEPVTASVLVDAAGALGQSEIEAITFLVASSVEGLEPAQVTVASTDGTMLHAAGEDSAPGVGNRQLRMTREFETALSGDVATMLNTVLGPGRASVVVRAELDFDERATESETYTPESATPVRQQIIAEEFNGEGSAPIGTVGIEGEAIDAANEGAYDYSRNEETTEYGIDRVVVRTTGAPGTIERLSVAVVVDDGTLTGVTAADPIAIEELVVAAVGIKPERGDTVEVSAVPFPESALPADEPVEEEGGSSLFDLIPTVLGGLALLIVAGAFFLMTRGGKKQAAGQLVPGTTHALSAGEAAQPGVESLDIGGLAGDVIELVERQPEEIATLLRSWLADRREMTGS